MTTQPPDPSTSSDTPYLLFFPLPAPPPGWLAGGWWFSRREMTEVELLDMKSRELRNGRLAM